MKLFVLNAKIVLLSYVFNPGAILIGLALYGILLEKKPFGFLSEHPVANFVVLALGFFFILVNFYFVSRLSKKRNMLKSKRAE